jgi:hypothetical protein
MGARAARTHTLPDGLKMNCVWMKSTELKMLWQLVKSGETRPLSAADMALLLRIRFALQEYTIRR